jgi:hypothetical protein
MIVSPIVLVLNPTLRRQWISGNTVVGHRHWRSCRAHHDRSRLGRFSDWIERRPQGNVLYGSLASRGTVVFAETQIGRREDRAAVAKL